MYIFTNLLFFKYSIPFYKKTMTITINRVNDAYHFEANNDTGNILTMDGSPDIGGLNKGFRPMQSLLASLGGCSAIDVILILKKQKEPVEDIKVELSGERHQVEGAKPFKSIRVHFILKGKLSEKKVARAIELSSTKYCSVGFMLREACDITYDFTIVD